MLDHRVDNEGSNLPCKDDITSREIIGPPICAQNAREVQERESAQVNVMKAARDGTLGGGSESLHTSSERRGVLNGALSSRRSRFELFLREDIFGDGALKLVK